MAKTAHIKLGAVGTTLRDYLVAGGPTQGIRRFIATPFTEKLGSGEQKYQDDIQWEYWTMNDWQAGVGRTDPEGGGFLYGEIESRVPGQLILPPLVRQADLRIVDETIDDCRYLLADAADLSGTSSIQAGQLDLAIKFKTPTSGELPAAALRSTQRFWICMQVPYGKVITFSLHTDDTGDPASAEIDSDSVTSTNRSKSYEWFSVALTTSGLSLDTTYWLKVAVDSGSASYLESTSLNTGLAKVGTDGTSWIAADPPFWGSDIFGLNTAASTGTGVGFIRFNSSLYAWQDKDLYKFSTANNNWVYTADLTDSGANTTAITGAVVFGPNIYFSRAGGNYTTVNTSDAVTTASSTATLFALHKGLLYRANGEDLYYSENGTTWVGGPFAMGGSDVAIRGMAGMGDSFFCATDKALLRLGPGDFVAEAFRFGGEDATNGRGMINYQGALYIPAAGRIFRYDESGQMLDIWASKDDDLVAGHLGRIEQLVGMNNWLVALVSSESATVKPTVWAWQTSGWHFLAALPHSPTVAAGDAPDYALYYDRGTSRLWMGGTYLATHYIQVDDYALNPYNLDDYEYFPAAWLETDWFDGRILERQKDFESVVIDSEQNLPLQTGQIEIDPYWQDDDSTDWEAMVAPQDTGILDVRWSDYTTRPNTRRLKLGISLHVLGRLATPRIRAINTKFLANVVDRYGWTLDIMTGDDLEGTNGELLNAFTGAQQRTHLDALEKQTAPFLLEDEYGTSWEVRVVKATHENYEYERKLDGNKEYGRIYHWTVEQTQDSSYVP